MDGIDTDNDEIEFELDESGGANDIGLGNHPPYLRLSCSFAVGYLPLAISASLRFRFATVCFARLCHFFSWFEYFYVGKLSSHLLSSIISAA